MEGLNDGGLRDPFELSMIEDADLLPVEVDHPFLAEVRDHADRSFGGRTGDPADLPAGEGGIDRFPIGQEAVMLFEHQERVRDPFADVLVGQVDAAFFSIFQVRSEDLQSLAGHLRFPPHEVHDGAFRDEASFAIFQGRRGAVVSVFAEEGPIAEDLVLLREPDDLFFSFQVHLVEFDLPFVDAVKASDRTPFGEDVLPLFEEEVGLRFGDLVQLFEVEAAEEVVPLVLALVAIGDVGLFLVPHDLGALLLSRMNFGPSSYLKYELRHKC